jgi:hypothetical protein
MFLLFGGYRGRRGKIFLAIRLGLLAVFLVAVLAFHAHGTTLDVLQGARFLVLIALVGSIVLARRRRSLSGGDGDSTSGGSS